MGAAARMGDSTAHGGKIVAGAPTVLIGGKPAARLGDGHMCPAATGTQPHLGGQIAAGSSSIFIEGKPAARAGDSASCPGAPNSIATGEPTVLIG